MTAKVSKETLYRIFLLVSTLLLLKAFTWIFTGQQAYILDASTSKIMRIHSGFTYLAILVLLWLNRRGVANLLAYKPVAVVFIYFLLSGFWASDFRESFRMSTSLFFQILIALAICKSANFPRIIERLSFIAIGIILLNLVFMVGFKQLAFESGYFGGSYEGSFRGIFSSKNTFGAIMAVCFSVLFTKYYLSQSPRNKQFSLISYLGAAALMLFASMSATSLITAFASMFIVALLSSNWFLQSTQQVRVTMVLSTFLIITFGILATEPILQMLGRDLTFTGRTDLWGFAWDAFSEKPIIGYGLNSFWREMLANGVLEDVGLWNVGQAHNGFVDALLAGGVVGLTLVVWLYWLMLKACVNNLLKTRLDYRTVLLVVLFWITFVQNLSETSFPYAMRLTGVLITIFFILNHRIKTTAVQQVTLQPMHIQASLAGRAIK